MLGACVPVTVHNYSNPHMRLHRTRRLSWAPSSRPHRSSSRPQLPSPTVSLGFPVLPYTFSQISRNVAGFPVLSQTFRRQCRWLSSVLANRSQTVSPAFQCSCRTSRRKYRWDFQCPREPFRSVAGPPVLSQTSQSVAGLSSVLTNLSECRWVFQCVVLSQTSRNVARSPGAFAVLLALQFIAGLSSGQLLATSLAFKVLASGDIANPQDSRAAWRCKCFYVFHVCAMSSASVNVARRSEIGDFQS